MSSSSSSSFSSSSSSIVLDLLHDIIVAMACREYGEGRIFIHTDRIGGFKTGHGDNPKEFWRKILEWTSKKFPSDLIRVGFVINTQPSASDKIHSMKPISVDKLKISDLATVSLSNYDCIYIVGLPPSVSSTVTQNLEAFVENGGGLVIEYPNVGGENINVLRNIENIYCYSSQRLLASNAYWTIDGGNNYVFYGPAEISFMSTLRQADFSEDWTILMTNIPNTVTTTTTTAPDEVLDFDQHSGSEFTISFISSMQDGIAALEPGSESTSSSNSSESSSSSSGDSNSSSSENINWNLCDNIVAEWRMDDNKDTSIAQSIPNNFLLTGKFTSSGGDVSTQDRSVTGKISRALNFISSSIDRITTPSNTVFNFVNGNSDLPFSISLWLHPSNVTPTQKIIEKIGVWELRIASGQLTFTINNGSDFIQKSSTPILNSNQWSHIIVSYNGSGSFNGINFYLDGGLLPVSTTGFLGYSYMGNDNSILTFSGTTNPYDGYLDQVVIFDKALDQVEIEALYNLGIGTTDCEGEYWRTSSSSTSSSSSSSYINNWSSSSSSSP